MVFSIPPYPRHHMLNDILQKRVNFLGHPSNFWMYCPLHSMGKNNKLSSKAAGELMDLSFSEKGKQRFQLFGTPGPSRWEVISPSLLTSSNSLIQWFAFVQFSTWIVFPTVPSDTLPEKVHLEGQEIVIWASGHCKSPVMSWNSKQYKSVPLWSLSELVLPETFSADYFKYYISYPFRTWKEYYWILRDSIHRTWVSCPVFPKCCSRWNIHTVINVVLGVVAYPPNLHNCTVIWLCSYPDTGLNTGQNKPVNSS